MNLDNLINALIDTMAGYSVFLTVICCCLIKRWQQSVTGWRESNIIGEGLAHLLHGYKKDCKWYEKNLHFIRLAAEDPNGTLEEIQKLADDALKHEGREDDTTTK